MVISAGLIGIRVYFSDFLKTKSNYHAYQIVIIMSITVFATEFIAILFLALFSLDLFEVTVLTKTYIKYIILFPKLIFYSVLCYFLFWIIRLLQRSQAFFNAYEAYQNQAISKSERD